MTYIGETIKMLRKSKDMSQEELGKRLGVGRAAVNKYEKGIVENIPLKTIEKIAEIFNVSPIYLVGWDSKTKIMTYEERVVYGVKYFYTEEGVHLLKTYSQLSKEGRKKAIQYMEDLYQIHNITNNCTPKIY